MCVAINFQNYPYRNITQEYRHTVPDVMETWKITKKKKKGSRRIILDGQAG